MNRNHLVVLAVLGVLVVVGFIVWANSEILNF